MLIGSLLCLFCYRLIIVGTKIAYVYYTKTHRFIVFSSQILVNKRCNIFYFCYRSIFKNDTKQKALGIVLFFIFLSQIVSAQNPISGNQGFQILSEGNFTFTNGTHVHAPLAVGGNLILNTSSFASINMDGVGSYIFPGDGSTTTSLLVKGGITWSNGYASVLGTKYIHIGSITGSASGDNGNNSNTQVYPSGKSYNNSKRIENTIDQTPNPAVFQTVTTSAFDFTTVFDNYRTNSTNLSNCTANVQLQTSSSGGNITNNVVSSSQTVYINSLINGVNYLNLTTASLNNINGITFNARPSASKVLIINVPITANFVWNNSNMAGLTVPADAPYILWNFYGASTFNLTINTASQIAGSVFAPNQNLIKSGTGDIEGNLIATTITLGTGEIHNYQFNGSAAGCLICSNVTSAGSIGTSQIACGAASYDPTIFTELTAPTGGSGAFEYQWQSSTDNTTFTDINGATAQNYDAPSITTTTYYRRGVRRIACTTYLYSSSISVTLTAIPSAPTATDASRCGIGTVNLSASGCAGTYTWYGSSTGGSSLGTGASFTTPSISSTTTYYVDCTVNSCVSTKSSATATIISTTTPVATVISTGCSGSLGSITATNLPNGYATNINGGAWSTSKNSYTDLPSGTYSIGFQGGGCNTYANFTVNASTDNPLLSLAKTDPTCTTTGNITVTGSGGTTGLGSATYELWQGISGTTISNLTTNANYPNLPSSSTTLGILEGYTNAYDGFGGRISGYIVPPTTGTYYFWIASDDDGELWLSTNSSTSNKSLIANINGWTNSRQWNKYSTQKSVAISLVAGQIYYFEALYKEGGGGDNIAIGWAKPGEATTTPSEVIPGKYVRANVTSSTTTPVYQYKINSGSFQTSNVFSGLSAGTYTLTIMDAGGCTATSTITLTTSGSVAAPTTTGANRCSTGTVTLSASGCAGTYNWYAASIGGASLGTSASYTTQSISSTTTYYVDCTIGTCISSRASVIATVNAPQPSCTDIHAVYTTFNSSSPATTATTLWVNVHTKLTGQLTSNGDFLLFNAGKITLVNVAASWSTATIPDGKIIADNTVSTPITYFDIPTSTWITKVPLNYSSSDIFISGAAISSTNGYIASSGKSSQVTASFYSNKTFSSTWAYGLSAYQPTFTESDVAASGVVNAIANGTKAGTPTNQTGNLVSGGSGTGGTNYTGSYSSNDSYTACNYQTPPSISNNSSNICVNGTADLTASGCSGTVTWYNSLGGSIGSGVDFTTPNISNTTLYYADCTDNYCNVSPQSSISVVVYPLPSSPIANSGSRCSTGTVSLSASGCAGTYNWYAASTGGTSLGTGAAFTTPSISSTTNYYVDCTENGCVSATRSTVTATVIPLPSTPTGIDGSRCGTGTVSLSASGCTGTYNWYAASTGGVSLGTGAVFTTPSISSTTTYYVDCTINTCASATRATAIATIIPLPTAPTTTGAGRCSTGTVTLSASGCAGTYNWYAASTGGVSLGTSATYTTPSISSTTTYYVDCTVGSCVSAPRATAIATITPIPSAPTGTGASRCGTGTVSLSASGCAGTYNWYAASTGGVSLGTGGTFTTPSISSTTTYYVDCTVNTCVSATRSATTATITPIPSAPTGTGASRCGTGTVSLSASGCAGTYNWYAASTGGASLGTGTAFTTPSISSTTTYYVDCTVTGCASATRATATATVITLPSAPTGIGASRCGTGTVSLSASGCAGTYNWYAASTGGASLGTGATFTTPSISSTTTYYVDCTVTGCASTIRSAATATINTIPTPTSSSNTPIVVGGTLNLFSSGGTSYNWVGPNNFVSNQQNSSTVGIVGLDAGIYTVTVTSNGCSATSTTQVVVNNYDPGAIDCSLVPSLNFANPTLISGTALANNAQYRFSNVISGVDAILTIVGRSHSNIVIVDLDLPAASYGGFDAAFQPMVDYNWILGGGQYDTPGEKSITFKFDFVNTGTMTPTSIPNLIATGLDIDGSGDEVREFIQASNYQSYQTQSPTSLTLSGALKAKGPLTTYAGINEFALDAMISFAYINNSSITITYGGDWNGSTSGFGDTSPGNSDEKRLNSLNFKCYNFNSTVCALPLAAPTATGATTCGNGTVNLSASGCTGTYYWYTTNTGGVAVGIGSSFTTPSISTTTTYYVECNAVGCTSPRTSVVATVNTIPTASVTGTTICVGNAIALSASGGSTYSWVGPNSFTSNIQNPTISNGQVGNAGVYTVTVISSAGCSATATANVVVNVIPSSPTSAGNSRCGTGTVALSASGCAGGTISWYNTLTGGSALTTGANYTTPSLSITTTYYIECSQNNCVSLTRNSAVATINAIPNASATSNSPIIGGTLNLYATAGDSYYWTGPNGFTSTLKDVSISPVTGNMANIYTVTVNLNGCTATATTGVSLMTNDPGGIDCSLIPTLNFTNPTLISGTAGANNAQYRFSNITGGTDAIVTIMSRSHANISIIDLDIPAATYGGYDAAMQPIIDYNWINGDGTFNAAGERSVTFKIDFVVTGTTTPKVMPNFIASGIDIDGSGDEVREFIQSSDYQSHQVQTPTSLTLSGALKAKGSYATYVGINELALDAIISYAYVNTSSITITYGAEWNGNTANFVDNANPTMSDERRLNSLYFKCENLNTTVCDVALAAPVGTPASRCGTGTVTLEASGCFGTYKWYNSATGGTSIGTSNTFTTSSITSTTAYYVECDAVGCISNRTTVIATINTIPSAPTVSSNSICGVGSVTLSGSNCVGTINWFNSQTGGTSIGTGTSFTASALTSSAVYFASCTSTNNCVSPSRNYGVATINPIPEAILTGINSLCLGYQASNNGKLLLNKFETSDLFSYNIGSNYDSGTASAFNAIPINGEILNSIADPSTNITYTVRIKNEENCTIDRMVTLTNQCSFCPAGYCEPANIIKTK